MKSLRSLIAAVGVVIALVLPTFASAQSSASAYTSATRYDAVGRPVGIIAPDPDGSGPLKHLASRTTYDTRGNVTKVESGELSGWQDETRDPHTQWGSAFTVQTTTETTFDTLSRKLTDRVKGSNGVTISLTQYSYDNRGRLECTAVRMNPATYDSLPSSACTLGTQGSQGPDRITRTFYDAASQVLKVAKGVGTSIQITDVMYSYTANGQIENVVDANGNRAKYIYDAHDRLERWYFPNKTRPTSFNPNAATVAASGASTPTWTDQEAYTYDNNGNRLTLRKRDGSVINYEYDALNRVTRKTVPERPGLSSNHTRDVFYAYDLQGNTTRARFNALSNGYGLTYHHDGFGRVTHEFESSADGTARGVQSAYDKNSNRTRVTHHDGRYFNYSYDGLNRLDQIKDQWNTPLIDLAFNNRGLLQNNNRWSSTPDQTFSYDPAGRLSSTGWINAGTRSTTWNYTRNPASQINTETQSNDGYSWNGHVNVNRAYTTNGLNQYTNAGGANFTYDANGNLTSDGTKTYQYDIENRLVYVSGGGRTTELYYDPIGRLVRIQDSQLGRTNFFHDGNALVAEYNSSGAMTRRHIHGSNVDADDPLVSYNGAGLSSVNDARYLFTDPRGSIVMVTKRDVNTAVINTYDEYGIPDTASGNDISTKGRFRYTGQMWIPELGMYYYKARIYSPTLGRFLQTDPIGYEDQYNLYAYVGNDPVNGVDPTGMECVGQEDGSAACDPPGDDIGNFTIPAEHNPGYIGPNESGHHVYNAEASTPSSGNVGESITQAVIDNPTPGNDSPATPGGVVNDAGISPFSGAAGDNVVSYVTQDSNGNTVVVNVTVPGQHFLNPGYVAQAIVPGNHSTTIFVVGEGNARIQQGPGSELGGAVFQRKIEGDIRRGIYNSTRRTGR